MALHPSPCKEFPFGYQEYLDISFCRICGAENGDGEFTLRDKETTFRWPNGYIHYLDAHNVEPSAKFVQFINGVDLEERSEARKAQWRRMEVARRRAMLPRVLYDDVRIRFK
jgi:hypothetical protein